MSKLIAPSLFMTITGTIVSGCLVTLTSCSSPQITDSADPLQTSTIKIERTVHFVNASKNATLVQPGTYQVSSMQGTLLLTKQNSSETLRLDTKLTAHEETLDRTTPLSFSAQEDEHVVMLLFPDGSALETVGSYSGIQSRAIRQSGKRMSRATIKRQLKQRRRIPHATPYHFTLRVPAKLNNLSPDIDKIKIRCFTFSGNDATKPDRRVGEGETIKNVTNQQFHGTIAVRFNASPGNEPEAADNYTCMLSLHKPGIGFRQPVKYGHPSANSAPAWRVSANETPFLRSTVAPVN